MVNHIGFIMDGNRRYSKKNNISLKKGYEVGMKQFLEVLKFQIKKNIKHTSFFALSSDNYEKREEKELKPIIDLLRVFLEDKELIQFLIENKINLNIKGDIENIENKRSFLQAAEKLFIKNINKKVEEINQKVGGGKFNAHIAINYDGQEEILNSFKQLLKKGIKEEELTIKKIKENIYFNDVKAPEIIVRPGNAPRLSGFLLFDSQYSEIYLTKKLWPELNQEDFEEIINWYDGLKRNFGK